MIQSQKLTPSVYYNRSRDFQLIGRLYDVVFNYVKSNVDSMSNLPCGDDVDERLLDLMCYTLGIKKQHNYVSQQLKDICNVFVELIRNKGSITSIKKLITTILHSNKLNSKGNEIIFDTTTNELKIYLDETVSDYSLINDILDYILPAGITFTIYKGRFSEYEFETVIQDEFEAINLADNSKASVKSNIQRREDLVSVGGVGVDVTGYDSKTTDNTTIVARETE